MMNHDFHFYTDRNGKFRGRLQAEGFTFTVGPCDDRALLFKQLLSKLHERERAFTPMIVTNDNLPDDVVLMQSSLSDATSQMIAKWNAMVERAIELAGGREKVGSLHRHSSVHGEHMKVTIMDHHGQAISQVIGVFEGTTFNMRIEDV